jgi:hypothetical protein
MSARMTVLGAVHNVIPNLIVLMNFLRHKGVKMEAQSVSVTSGDYSVWIWIILVGLLLLGALVGVGALALINATGQAQLPAASQPVPPR